MTNGKNIWLWALQILAAAAFFFFGGLKLAGAPAMVQTFQTIGLGQWFRYLTGALEVGGAALLLIPALAVFGALLLMAVMIGAIFTHLFILGGAPIPAAALLIALSAIAWARRRQIGRMLRF